jgi:hypothetical protein
VEWALASLPESWLELIEWSQAHTRDMGRDESKAPDVLEFLRWAAEGTA